MLHSIIKYFCIVFLYIYTVEIWGYTWDPLNHHLSLPSPPYLHFHLLILHYHSSPAISTERAPMCTNICLSTKQRRIRKMERPYVHDVGLPPTPLSWPACCCAAYKSHSSYLLSASHTTAIHLPKSEILEATFVV